MRSKVSFVVVLILEAVFQKLIVADLKAEDFKSVNLEASQQESRFKEESLKLKKWEKPTHNVKIDYPEKWFVKENDQGKVYQVFFSAENIDEKGYFSTGIMLIKLYDYLHPEEPFDANSFIDRVIKSINQEGELITEEREEITTEAGVKGMLAKISFVNYKGEKETEFLAVFTKDTTMVSITCEAPIKDFPYYEKMFKKIILSAEFFD